MENLLPNFENKAPEIVFEWNDKETNAKGWLVINSLRGGAAAGGTRIRKGLPTIYAIHQEKVLWPNV